LPFDQGYRSNLLARTRAAVCPRRLQCKDSGGDQAHELETAWKRDKAVNDSQGEHMTPHEEHRPHAEQADSAEKSGWPFILGAAAIIAIGVWLYTGREETNLVTGADAPAGTQTLSK
jgi:hypothetical protein